MYPISGVRGEKGKMAATPARHTEQAEKEAHSFLQQAGAYARHYGRLPLPADLNWWWTIGAMLVAVLVLMLLSGLTLTLAYTPDASLAFGSVEAIERRMPSGWLLRAMHMTGASFFMAALYAHLLRGLYYRTYLPPRRSVWLSGCGLLVLVMVTAFAGYVLPWGQMSYWGADVAAKAVGAVPFVGQGLEQVFLGGESPGTPTLHRMLTLHFLLAFVIIGLVLVHVAVVHAKGSSSPSVQPETRRKYLPFYPYFTTRDILAILVMSLGFVAMMCFWPGLITEPANYRPANPLHTPADIEPEWYFLPFYGMLQVVPSKFWGLLVSGGAVAVLFAVPWLDKGRRIANSGLARLADAGALLACVGAAVTAAAAGVHHAQGGWLLAGQAACLVYYLYFLVFLPLRTRFEGKEA